MKVAIAGASGFTGAELLRLCASHPDWQMSVAGADTQAGQRIADLYPSLAPCYRDLTFSKVTANELKGSDICFLALPHGESAQMAADLIDEVGLLVDLSADFRLKDVSTYEQWYHARHPAASLIDRFAYGLPELNRAQLVGAKSIAAPGCYPTAAALALSPFVHRGLVERSGIIVDAASGVSGAGRKLALGSHFNTVDENFVAYGLVDHRHTPEIEQALGAQVLFTPHLAPMNRGILATCYARPKGSIDTTAAIDVLHDTYHDEPFVVVSDQPPSTKATLGSNSAHLTARVDERTGWLISLCAIDNLVKGASGQAVQCANVALGIAETTGLPVLGVYP